MRYATYRAKSVDGDAPLHLRLLLAKESRP